MATKVKTHLYIATPAYGCTLTTAYATSLLQLQALCMQRGIEVSVDLIGNESLVQRARNILQARFLKSPATHLLFIDADIAFAPEAVVDRLLAANKDVVTGAYAKKSINWGLVQQQLLAHSKEPVHSLGLDFNINIAEGEHAVTNGVVEVLDAATGMMLIQRHVIEKMWDAYAEELWCKNDIRGDTNIDHYIAIFDCFIDEQTRRYLSEDYAFSRRWQLLGGKIYADIGFPLAHLGTHTFVGDVRHRFSLTYVD